MTVNAATFAEFRSAELRSRSLFQTVAVVACGHNQKIGIGTAQDGSGSTQFTGGRLTVERHLQFASQTVRRPAAVTAGLLDTVISSDRIVQFEGCPVLVDEFFDCRQRAADNFGTDRVFPGK